MLLRLIDAMMRMIVRHVSASANRNWKERKAVARGPRGVRGVGKSQFKIKCMQYYYSDTIIHIDDDHQYRIVHQFSASGDTTNFQRHSKLQQKQHWQPATMPNSKHTPDGISNSYNSMWQIEGDERIKKKYEESERESEPRSKLNEVY